MLVYIICVGILSAQAAATNLTSPKEVTRGSSSVEGCRLPDFPGKGRYVIHNYEGRQKIVPGNVVAQFTMLIYSCRKNFEPTMTNSVCQKNNTWSNNPKCRKRCILPTSYSVNFKCYSPEGLIPCSPRLPNGSTIHPTCKDGYLDPEDLSPQVCYNGKWTGAAPDCKPVCGVENKPSRRRRIVHGADAVRGAFSWYAGIYQDFGGTIDYICGGTLLQTNVVISAAHCFYDVVRKAPMPTTYYRVAVGKIYRSWDNEAERDLEGVQKSEIKQIFLPENYKGDETYHQFDVSLLELATPVRLSAAVRPICIDLLDEEFDKRQLEPQSIGRVAGWGSTEAGIPSETLKALSVPVVGLKECRQEMSKYKFARYLTSDKLCAGYTNGSSLCQGDGGDGLVFPDGGLGQQTRWFLRAIASNGPLDASLSSCRTNTYTAYTHIFKLKDWIGRVLQALS